MNWFKGNVGETSERQGGAHNFYVFCCSCCFSERLDTILKCDGNGIDFTRLGGCTADYF